MGHSQGNSGDWGLRADELDSRRRFQHSGPLPRTGRESAGVQCGGSTGSPGLPAALLPTDDSRLEPIQLLRLGDLTLLSSNQVLAYRRQSAEETVLVAINYDNHPATVTLAAAKSSSTLTPLGGWHQSRENGSWGQIELQLAPNEIRLYRVTR